MAACTQAVSPSRCGPLTPRTSPPPCPPSRWSWRWAIAQFLGYRKILTQQHPLIFDPFCLQVSHSACVMTTAVICKLLRSKEAMATVDIRNWPPVLDTGTVASLTHTTVMMMETCQTPALNLTSAFNPNTWLDHCYNLIEEKCFSQPALSISNILLYLLMQLCHKL